MTKTTHQKTKSPIFGLAIAGLLMMSGNVLAQPYINGNLSTGTLTKSGALAPIGYTWSEAQNEPGATFSNSTTGVGAQIVPTGGNRVADDFTIPAGQTWNITKITFYGYQTDYSGPLSPFTDVRVRIQNGLPSNSGSAIVFGDLTTNRLLQSSDAMMYRVPNTTTPSPGTAPLLNRKIFKIEATVSVTLTAGTYWIEWQQLATGGSNFSPPSTVVDVRTQPGYNAVQWLSDTSVWNPIIDAGNPSTAADVPLDMPFMIDYTTSTMGTSDKAFAAGISIYPNPAKNFLNISSETILDAAEIYDVTGRLVKLVRFNGLISNSINVQSLTGGNYIVKMKSGDLSVARKFIKQ